MVVYYIPHLYSSMSRIFKLEQGPNQCPSLSQLLSESFAAVMLASVSARFSQFCCTVACIIMLQSWSYSHCTITLSTAIALHRLKPTPNPNRIPEPYAPEPEP